MGHGPVTASGQGHGPSHCQSNALGAGQGHGRVLSQTRVRPGRHQPIGVWAICIYREANISRFFLYGSWRPLDVCKIIWEDGRTFSPYREPSSENFIFHIFLTPLHPSAWPAWLRHLPSVRFGSSGSCGSVRAVRAVRRRFGSSGSRGLRGSPGSSGSVLLPVRFVRFGSARAFQAVPVRFGWCRFGSGGSVRVRGNPA